MAGIYSLLENWGNSYRTIRRYSVYIRQQHKPGILNFVTMYIMKWQKLTLPIKQIRNKFVHGISTRLCNDVNFKKKKKSF